MHKFLYRLLKPASSQSTQYALCIMRIGIGLLTIGHGIPKIMGGTVMWQELGTFVNPLGIYFLPIMWGFFGACTEFLGGIAFTLGLGTRIASICLSGMMLIATIWHVHRGDPYNLYSFPLSLIVVFVAFIIMGGGAYSIDGYLASKKSSML